MKHKELTLYDLAETTWDCTKYPTSIGYFNGIEIMTSMFEAKIKGLHPLEIRKCNVEEGWIERAFIGGGIEQLSKWDRNRTIHGFCTQLTYFNNNLIKNGTTYKTEIIPFNGVLKIYNIELTKEVATFERNLLFRIK